MAIYFLIGLLPRTIEITLKSVVRFLVACLVSELLNGKDNRYPPSCFIIRSILMTLQAGRNEIKLTISCLNATKFSKNFSTYVRGIDIQIQQFLTLRIFRMCSLRKTNFTLLVTSWIF